MEIALFYIPCPNKTSATEIATTLIDEQLVACTNLFEGISMFHWADALQRDTEMYLICKTSIAMIDKVEKRISEIHPYDTPAIIHWIAQVNDSYGKWVKAQIDDSQD